MKWLEFSTKNVYTEIGEDGETYEREVITPMMVEDNEAGRAYAEEMSYDGIIEEYDDGEPIPEYEPTAEEMFNALLGVE